MKKYIYKVNLGNEVVNHGETTRKTEALKAFKGYGRNSWGNIIEVYPDGSRSEIGHKAIGRKLYCW
jgi:hypothetical protein